MKTLSWEDTLEQYLACSNEDQKIEEFFLSCLVSGELKDQSRVTWLDVGTGTGTTTLRIANSLSRYFEKTSSRLIMADTCFHSNDSSARSLERRARKWFGETCAIGVDIEDSLNERIPFEFPDINLVTAIHFFYDKKAVRAFVSLLDQLGDRKPLFVYAISESPQSDFYRIREALRGLKVDCAFTTLDSIHKLFRAAGFDVESVPIEDQFCKLDHETLDESQDYWLFPFLLGCSRMEFLDMGACVRDRVCRTVRQYVQRENKSVLSVPDVALVAKRLA